MLYLENTYITGSTDEIRSSVLYRLDKSFEQALVACGKSTDSQVAWLLHTVLGHLAPKGTHL